MSDPETRAFISGCFAFFAAPLAPATAGALIFGNAAIAFPIFVVAFLHVLFLAMPLYAYLSMRWRPTFANVLAASFLVGALPVSILIVLGSLPHRPPWQDLAEGAGDGGLFGLSGGLLFWLILSPQWRGGSCR